MTQSSYESTSQIMCCPESVVLRSLPHFTIICGILMVEQETNRMVFVEQRAREELPPGIVGLPKGTFEVAKDKTFRDCAIREFCEETNANSETFRAIHLGRIATILNYARLRITIIFTCTVPQIPALSRGSEIERIVILTPDDVAQLPQKSMSKETAMIVRVIDAISQSAQSA